jgi:hypothetical protein
VALQQREEVLAMKKAAGAVVGVIMGLCLVSACSNTPQTPVRGYDENREWVDVGGGLQRTCVEGTGFYRIKGSYDYGLTNILNDPACPWG